MRLWDKSLKMFHGLCDKATQSVRCMAQQPGLSKSSVHRLTQAMERRHSHPECWLWETADGRQWLTRLVVATLSTVGLKRGGGLDTLSEFFARLHLETQVGCSPSALRGVMQALEAALLETAATWEQDGQARGDVRESIGAVDETFLERMILVFMDLTTGYLLFEAVAADRSYATWQALVDEGLKVLGTRVRYLVSDRAKALIQLAEQGLECLSMPDFFPGVHALLKSYALAIGRRLPQAPKQLAGAEHALARSLEHRPGAPASPQAQGAVEASRTEVRRWEAVHRTERHHLATLSLTRHPCTLHDSAPQTSAQVQHRLQAAIDAMDLLAQEQQLPARHATLKKVRNQVPALAALGDFWWEDVVQDLEQGAIAALWRTWARELLRPWV